MRGEHLCKRWGVIPPREPMTRCLKRPILPGMKERFTVANRAYLSERRLAARAMLDRVWVLGVAHLSK